MTKQEAIKIVGGSLSTVKKMPGFGFGLSAKNCIMGSKLRSVQNSTCSKCYALKGNYTFPHVVEAHKRRLENLNDPLWVEAIISLILSSSSWNKFGYNHDDTKYFRWHDSGDLQSVQHLENIAKIARKLPSVKFWLPTREYQIVKDWLLNGGVRPKNLTIRLSAHMVNGPLPIKLAKELGVRVSGVHTHDQLPTDAKICEARTRGNVCGPCRACWDNRVLAVSYEKH